MHSSEKTHPASSKDELGWLVDCLRDGLEDLDRAVTIVDHRGRFVFYNHASARMDGVDPALLKLPHGWMPKIAPCCAVCASIAAYATAIRPTMAPMDN